MTQENRLNRQPDPEPIQVRRNPYLVDYRTGKNTVRHAEKVQNSHTGRYTKQPQNSHTGKYMEKPQNSIPSAPPVATKKHPHPQHTAQPQQKNKVRQQKPTHSGSAHGQIVYKDNTYSTRIRQRRARAERQRRRRQARLRKYFRIALLCAGILVGIVVLKNLLKVPASTAEAGTPAEIAAEVVQQVEKQIGETTGTRIQGLPADVYEAHPAWTEDFLTVNEYSRPGDPLPEVKNIFVHYTANPGTSAAQNRSYFEQLKDNHERSASAHFIIGYNGEILQCVPLDEIAYAVQTRNEDSISIECCYKADNGQFTRETYDSLIELLKWLTDAYDLEADDILRHYDCGGKKCPIYYTEHEDAWNRLKEDVKNQ